MGAGHCEQGGEVFPGIGRTHSLPQGRPGLTIDVCYWRTNIYKIINHMKIFFNGSLCRKCPFGHMQPCLYKKVFYRHVLPPYSRKKLIHKCEFYRTIFFTGQHVVIDLYHKVRGRDNRWEYVIAKKNVAGTITGVRGSKYFVELFEACFLQRKDHVKVYLHASQPAKMIRPFDYSTYSLDEAESLRLQKENILSIRN